MNSLFDTHAHLTSLELLPNLDSLLETAKHAGVWHILNICTDPHSLKEGIALEKRAPWIRNAGATTPHDVGKEGEACFELFASAARSRQLIAIGETGLDYHYEHSAKKVQQEFLVRYLHLALECQLPVIFHCREAFSDLFAITDQEYKKGAPAILHCFTGTTEEAKEGVERGWMVSLSGIITFKKSESLREVARQTPMEHLLIETDAPYLAPQTKRGQMNEPAFIFETLHCLADLKGMSPDACARCLTENAKRILKC
jgi:TatD DNase family protein